MATYVYICPKNKKHPQLEITHGMKESPTVRCLYCKSKMHRKPQRFTFGFQPEEVLTEWMDDNYRRWRTHQPRHSPDRVKRPVKPLPQIRLRDYRKDKHGD